MKELSIVIVNYNGGALLRQCLESLWAQLEAGWEVLVIDNASPDASAEGVETGFPGLRVIRNLRNVGFAAANNQSIRLANGRYVLLLNPDVMVEPGGIRLALDYMDAQPEVSILGPKIMLPDGRVDPAAHRSFKTPETYLYKMTGLSTLFPRHRRFGRYYLSFLPDDEIAAVDSVVGAFLLIRRSVIDRIGLLDERFFMYCEDEDWCWRAKQAGGRVVYHPGVIAHHRKGSSTRQVPLRMAYHWHRSLFLYHRKNIAPAHSAVVNAAVYGGIAAGFALKAAAIVARKTLSAARSLVRPTAPARAHRDLASSANSARRAS